MAEPVQAARTAAIPHIVSPTEGGVASPSLLGQLLDRVNPETYRHFAPFVLLLIVIVALLLTFGQTLGGAGAFEKESLFWARIILAVLFIVALVLTARSLRTSKSDRALRKRESKIYRERLDKLPFPERDEDLVRVIPADQAVRLIEYESTDEAGHEPTLIAFVSGKGGVGKSVLALGLLEYSSSVVRTQLVDFDFHNKGLTSLLRRSGDSPRTDYLLDMMNDFLQLPGLNALEPYFVKDNPKTTDTEFHNLYSDLVWRFVGTPQRNVPIRGFHFSDKIGQRLYVPGVRDPLTPYNASFVPSVRLGEVFLGSPSSESRVWRVYLFFKLLSLRARVANAVIHQIVDCHGAHDILTAGLICSATHVVIVTTPEMGSLDGTYELLRYSLALRKSQEKFDPRTILVVNRCLPEDPNFQQIEGKWSGLVSEVVRIERTERIERLGRSYRFGDIARDGYLRSRMDEIQKALEL